MKNYLYVLLLMVLGLPQMSYALTDADYERMKANSETFSDADTRLNQVWKEVKNKLDKSSQAELVTDQTKWIRNGWDRRASKLASEEGLTQADAYARAAEERIEYLENYGDDFTANANLPVVKVASANTAQSQEPNAGMPKVVTVASAEAVKPAAAATQERITVEAEGSGETKMAAMKDAWTNAVRQAVGMYLASNSSVKSDGLDDKYTEDIAAYSRGQVNSFETLSENQENGLWHIKIRANVDKDILQETVAAASTQSVKVDGASLAAQSQSASDRKKDAAEVLKSSGLLDFKKCLDYQASLVSYTIDGEVVHFMQHVLKFDLNKYYQQARELEKLLGQIAVSKRNIKLEAGPANNAYKILAMKEYKLPLDLKNPSVNIAKLSNLGAWYYYMPMMANWSQTIWQPHIGDINKNNEACHDFQIRISEGSPYSEGAAFKIDSEREKVKAEWCIVGKKARGVCYEVPSSVREMKLDNVYEVIFNISTADDNFDEDISMDLALPPIFNEFGSYNWMIGPEFLVYKGNNRAMFLTSSEFTPIIIVLQKLDIEADKLATLNELTAKYELQPTDKEIK